MPKTREEINQQKREHYHKNKESIRKKQKEYYQKNKEKLIENQKEYYIDHKEQIKEYKKQYAIENKERFLEYNKEQSKLYRKTELGVKFKHISRWRSRGVIGDYEEMYERYKNTEECDNCGIELTKGGVNKSNTKVLDHSHITGEFRNILCLSCNIKRR